MGEANEFRFMHADAALKFREEVARVLCDSDRAAVSLEPGANSEHPWRVYLPSHCFKSGVTRREVEVIALAAARPWIFGADACWFIWAGDMP